MGWRQTQHEPLPGIPATRHILPGDTAQLFLTARGGLDFGSGGPTPPVPVNRSGPPPPTPARGSVSGPSSLIGIPSSGTGETETATPKARQRSSPPSRVTTKSPMVGTGVIVTLPPPGTQYVVSVRTVR